jgi:site-specific DNA-adenine methylase
MNTETEKSGDWREDVRPYRSKPCAKVICYYGSKYRLARRYPAPQHDTIIEPFAGSTGYALHYPEKSVHLYDLSEKVCAVWDYVIQVNPEEIRRLPILTYGERVDDYADSLPQEARWLIGWWLGVSRPEPTQSHSPWGGYHLATDSKRTWTPKRREAVAQTSERVKHWKITRGSYADIEDQRASWFIDPPYQCKAGRRYPHNGINFEHLAKWSRSRSGQVIVCENTNSDRWLPFSDFHATDGVKHKKTREVIWYQSDSSESHSSTHGEDP